MPPAHVLTPIALHWLQSHPNQDCMVPTILDYRLEPRFDTLDYCKAYIVVDYGRWIVKEGAVKQRYKYDALWALGFCQLGL